MCARARNTSARFAPTQRFAPSASPRNAGRSPTQSCIKAASPRCNAAPRIAARTGRRPPKRSVEQQEKSAMANPAPGYATKPDHRVDLLPEARRVRVTFGGTVIADSKAALRVEETGHGPVHYVPEKDVRLDLMRSTEHKTYCPFKGDCSYWTIEIDGGKA